VPPAGDAVPLHGGGDVERPGGRRAPVDQERGAVRVAVTLGAAQADAPDVEPRDYGVSASR
jgi:hypothetical protein